MTPYLDDGDVRLFHGDALEQLALMPSESVQCIITSPPFWGLRDYGTGRWEGGDADCSHTFQAGGTGKSTLDQYDNGLTPETAAAKVTGYGHATYRATCGKCGARRVDSQIGLEETPDEWCAKLVAVMREARRVLRSDGVCWIEVGDTYNAYNGNRGPSASISAAADPGRNTTERGLSDPTLKPKDLVGAPWLLAFALRADGWYLRSDTIWSRPNPMPESVTDRPTKAHSYVFLLTKSARYYYDADAIREQTVEPQGRLAMVLKDPDRYRDRDYKEDATGNGRSSRMQGPATNPAGRNARSVWSIPTEPTPFAHFATFPQALVERCIKAGTSEHGACSECGAPWRRITERETVRSQYADKQLNGGKNESIAGKHETPSFSNSHDSPQTTRITHLGWEPSCDHDAPVIPCRVLDCFMGSGTTALVARRLGRHATGIELNTDYLRIAATRLQQPTLWSELV